MLVAIALVLVLVLAIVLLVRGRRAVTTPAPRVTLFYGGDANVPFRGQPVSFGTGTFELEEHHRPVNFSSADVPPGRSLTMTFVTPTNNEYMRTWTNDVPFVPRCGHGCGFYNNKVRRLRVD